MFLGSFGVFLVLVGKGGNAQTRGWSMMTFSTWDSAETPISLLGRSFPTAQEGLFQGLVLKARMAFYHAVMSEKLASWLNIGSWDCYSFRCREMITGDCAEVAYWVTPSSAQPHFCLILVLNLQFVHKGKLKVFTGAITTYQLMKGTSSMSL